MTTRPNGVAALWRDPLVWLIMLTMISAGTLFVWALNDFKQRDSRSAAPTPIPTPTLTPEPSDPEAVALFKRIEAAMNQLSTLMIVEVLRDGSGRTLTTTIEIAAPDKVRLITDTGEEVIRIGQSQWARDTQESLWRNWTRGESYRFPDFNESQQAVDVQIESGGSLNGVPLLVVTYARLGFEGRFDFKLYADPVSFLIHRLTMDGPGHHMISDYVDYSPTVTVTAPSDDLLAPTPTVTIPN